MVEPVSLTQPRRLPLGVIVEYVPEGRIDPPSGHMRSPGTIGLREETFQALLTDIAHSLKVPALVSD